MNTSSKSIVWPVSHKTAGAASGFSSASDSSHPANSELTDKDPISLDMPIGLNCGDTVCEFNIQCYRFFKADKAGAGGVAKGDGAKVPDTGSGGIKEGKLPKRSNESCAIEIENL